MSDCIFCDIVAGQSPASLVYQDNTTLAFMDISSLNSGQVVVIPREHCAYLCDMDEAAGESLFTATTRVCRAIRNSGIPCDGINLFLADGEPAGQEVFHVHILVIPRLKNDTMKIIGDWQQTPRRELDELAEKIRQGLEKI
jgi:histidine triad (HIT) family protein